MCKLKMDLTFEYVNWGGFSGQIFWSEKLGLLCPVVPLSD